LLRIRQQKMLKNGYWSRFCDSNVQRGRDVCPAADVIVAGLFGSEFDLMQVHQGSAIDGFKIQRNGAVVDRVWRLPL